MDEVTLAAAIVAVLISGVALVFSRRSDRRDQRRLEIEIAEERARESARPTARYIDRASSAGSGRAYRFAVTNIGKADTLDLKAFLIDAEGNVVSGETDYLAFGGHLKSGERTDFELAVADDATERNPLFLRFTWIDPSGDRRSHTSNEKVPTH
jgi:hypothetical protein